MKTIRATASKTETDAEFASILAELLRKPGTTSDIGRAVGIDTAKAGRRLRALAKAERVTKRGDYWFSLEPDALMCARLRREASERRDAKTIELAQKLGLLDLTPSARRDDEDDEDYSDRLADEQELRTRGFIGVRIELSADDFLRIAEELVSLRAKISAR